MLNADIAAHVNRSTISTMSLKADPRSSGPTLYRRVVPPFGAQTTALRRHLRKSSIVGSPAQACTCGFATHRHRSSIITGFVSTDLPTLTSTPRTYKLQSLSKEVALHQSRALALLHKHKPLSRPSNVVLVGKTVLPNRFMTVNATFSSLGSLYYLHHTRSAASTTRSRSSGPVKSSGILNAPSDVCDTWPTIWSGSEKSRRDLYVPFFCTAGVDTSRAQCTPAHPGKNSTFRGGFDDSSADRSDTSQMHPPQFEVWHRDTLRAWGARISDLTVDLVRGSVVRQIGDGHCLFYCLLGRSDVEAAMALRSSIATHIVENFDQLLAGSTQSYNDILELEFFSGFVGDRAQKYYDIMANCTDFLEDNTAHWGGYLEIYAYCEISSSRADVYELAYTDASGINYFRHVYSVGNLSSPRIINLAFYGDHWNNVEFETPAPHMDLVPYIPAPVLHDLNRTANSSATAASTDAEFSNATATSSSDTSGPASTASSVAVVATCSLDNNAVTSTTPTTLLINRKRKASTNGANEMMALGATLDACYTCFVAEEGANQMWRSWTQAEAQRLGSWENYQYARPRFLNDFVLCYQQKYSGQWAWAKSSVVDGRSKKGKLVKKFHPESEQFQRKKAEAVDHYNNVIKRHMTRLDRHMTRHFPEDAKEWKKRRTALTVPDAAFDAPEALAAVQGEPQPEGSGGVDLNKLTAGKLFK